MRALPLLTVSLIALAAASFSARAADDLPASQTAAQTAVPDQAPTVAVVAKVSTSNSSLLHRLNTDAHQLRFEGETGSRVWPVFVTEHQAHSRARVRLSYTNAVSVMPEASKITVLINDTVVAESQIMAASDIGVVDVDIPEGVLEPGYNAFRINVQQRHRVDCSMQATYELWTQVDAAATGIAFPILPDEQLYDLTDLPAVLPDSTGATVIRAVVSPDADAPTLDRMLRIIQAVALRGGYGRPVVEVTDKINDQPGISLFIGTKDELAARGFGKEITNVDSVFLRGNHRTGHYDLFVTGQTDADIDEATNSLFASAYSDAPFGTQAGLQALAGQHGFHIAGDTTRTFRDLGLSNVEFNGRVFRSGFELQMPADYYPADYGKMTMKIDAGYAAGLSQGSQILVRVNDHDVASLMLPKPGGDVFRKRQINVPLSELRAGTNHIELEAQVAMPSDAACDATETLEAHKRFVLLEQSELLMPSIARIAHFPNLSATTVDGFPFSGQTGPTKLFVPRRDSGTLSAAASFVVRAAVNGRRPLITEFSFNKAEPLAGSAIIVGAFADLPREMIEAAGLDQPALKSSWAHAVTEKASEGEVSAIQNTAKQAQALAAQGTSAASTAKASKNTFRPNQASISAKKSLSEAEIYAQWSGEVKSDPWTLDLPAFATNWLHGLKDLGSRTFTVLKRSDDPYAPDQRARIVFAQHQAPAGGNKTWTLITAPNSEFLAKEMRDVSAPSIWNQLSGRVSTFDPKNNIVWAIQPEAEGYFIQTQPLSPGNMRLVTAGWLSNNIEYYVIGFLMMALALGFITNYVVRRSGTSH